MNVTVSKRVGLCSEPHKNFRHFGGFEEIGDGYVGVCLGTFDRIEGYALVDRVTLTNVLSPGSGDHEGWKIIHILGQRIVNDHTGLQGGILNSLLTAPV